MAKAVFAPPPALLPGSCLAVVAPSSPFDEDAFNQGVARLRERYDVRYDPDVLERKGYLAGHDQRRLAELTGALADADVDAIVAARGGYGATRLLEHLDVQRIAEARKLMIGFSDVTALHAAWARAGVRSLHGPMVAALGGKDPELVRRWIAAVEGAVPEPLDNLVILSKGHATGPLLGGNLAVLAALVGTPYEPPLDGAVLFLEDVGERPYRVDRMLTTLHHAGWLSRVLAIVLGAFTDTRAGPDGVTVEHVLEDRLGSLGVPVLAGIPSGHVHDNLELPLGAPVSVDADRGELRFLEASVTSSGTA